MLHPENFYPIRLAEFVPRKCIENWIATGTHVHLEKGSLVCSPGNLKGFVYLLLEGNAQVFNLHSNGKQCILGVLGPGDILGELNLFTDKDVNLFARALTDLSLVKISNDRFRNAVKENPELATGLLSHFSTRIVEMMELLEQIAYSKVEERLLFLLQKLSDYDQQKNGWSPIPIVLTHQDIAGMIASTRETVTQLINHKIKQGILRQENQRIWIRV